MTPGPVSDSYDPEFGTGENAGVVRDAATQVRQRVTDCIGDPELRDIVDVARELITGKYDPGFPRYFSERELRVIRFCIDRALESI